MVHARPDADPDDYFRFAGGRWHLRTHVANPHHEQVGPRWER